MKYIAET